MGAGDGSIAGCDSTGGKQGIFQYTARGTCTTTNLDPGATYIADIAGVRNYTGNAADVFKCIAALGEAGCGFEHQFAALLRALGADGRAAPAENQGFLRPDAYLAIIMLTNEDDCSATPGVPLFDTGSNTNIASQLGPPANFRCNEFGHNCDGAHPRRLAPNNDVASHGHVQQLLVERQRGLPAERRGHRESIEGAQGRPRLRLPSCPSRLRPPRTR